LIRVFIVDNDPAAVSGLRAIMEKSQEVIVLGSASLEGQGLATITQNQPDVICLQADMPGSTGLLFTQQIMMQCPTPILVLSSAVNASNPLLAAGAVDALAMPKSGLGVDDAAFSKELLRKIKVLSGVVVFKRNQANPSASPPPANLVQPTKQQIVVIGASTGGPQAFEAVLSKLPGTYPFPVVCVQHISHGFLNPFITWLNGKVKLPVSVARSGDKPTVGQIYFAPDHANLELDGLGQFTYSHAPHYLHYPNIDVTFQAIADYYSNRAIAVLMTGMGDDGASGLKAIALAGGITIAQDEASCVVFGMPKIAIETGAAQKILSLEQIGDQLCNYSKMHLNGL